MNVGDMKILVSDGSTPSMKETLGQISKQDKVQIKPTEKELPKKVTPVTEIQVFDKIPTETKKETIEKIVTPLKNTPTHGKPDLGKEKT